MDHRSALPAGSALPFPGMPCVIDRCIGRGSNAIVYEASYLDATSAHRKHHILVKELFPFDIRGHLWRDADCAVRRDAEGEALWQTHRLSFERGNDIHLQLLALNPDQLGGNINTFPLNGTLYTILDDSASRSLEKELAGKPAPSLRRAALWSLRLLDCLEVFHKQDFLHLDISLDNVLLLGEGEQERVMLIDYNSVHSRKEIQNGEALYFSAKEGFTAPEVQTGMYEDISFCTDLFSAAAVFFVLLMGKPPSALQLNRKTPPDAQDSPLLQDAPSTVREQVKKILRRGLCILPGKRYSSCASMKKDLQELLSRLDGLGVSHAALWEAGKRSVQRLVKRNPSLAYLEKEADLYPLRVTWEDGGGSVLLDAFMQAAARRDEGRPILLEGIGGGGKSTALLRAVLAASPVYAAKNPAMIYLPLYTWANGGDHFILDQILRELRFDSQTRTMEDARHALLEQLSQPLAYQGERRPRLLLMLDGLNEAAGDTADLLREIAALSHLPGLAIVIASRLCPEGLSARRAHLDLLTDQDVDQALSRHGLLIPENGEMRELLKTPLMLSLFIQTALSQGAQVQCETEKQLMDAYLAVLYGKAGQDGQQALYQAEAAVRLVLPAIAQATRKRGAPLNDQQLLRPVLKCRKMIDTRILSRVFPQWLGHGAEITGGGVSDEAWYGQIVHAILWKKLGLLTRDETGGYHIRHQILQEHLARSDAENQAAVRKARVKTGAVCAGALACLACVLLLFYTLWIRPRPYDETLSEMALDAALTQYTNAGLQYEAMAALLEGKTGPDACLASVQRWGTAAGVSAQAALEAMRAGGGSVVPWSRAPFDFENCLSLFALPSERAAAYPAYIRAYSRLLAGERTEEKEAFSAALSALIEADADLAWLLDRAVSFPHTTGMTEAREKTYQIGLLSLPSAQESRSPDLSRGLAYAIQKARERSREAQRALSRMPVLYEKEEEP